MKVRDNVKLSWPCVLFSRFSKSKDSLYNLHRIREQMVISGKASCFGNLHMVKEPAKTNLNSHEQLSITPFSCIESHLGDLYSQPLVDSSLFLS